MIWIFLLVVLPVTACVLVTVVVVGYLFVRSLPPRSVVQANASLQAAKLDTLREMEQWRQDWIIEQRRQGGHPALPPGQSGPT